MIWCAASARITAAIGLVAGVAHPEGGVAAGLQALRAEHREVVLLEDRVELRLRNVARHLQHHLVGDQAGLARRRQIEEAVLADVEPDRLPAPMLPVVGCRGCCCPLLFLLLLLLLHELRACRHRVARGSDPVERSD